MKRSWKSVAILGCAMAGVMAAMGCAGSETSEDTGTIDTPVDTTDTGFDTGIDTAIDTGGDPDVVGDDPGWDPDAEVPSTGVVGDRCTTASQCAAVPGSGRLCLTTFMSYLTFPGGYCSAVCTSAADCGAGSQCVDLYGFDTYCLESCTSAAQCRTSEGYSCTTLSGASGTFCLPPAAPDPESGAG